MLHTLQSPFGDCYPGVIVCGNLALMNHNKTLYQDMGLRTKTVLSAPLIAMILSLLVGFKAQPQSGSSPAIFKLGYVKDDSLLDNCGCSLYKNIKDEKKRRHIFLSDMSQKAAINIDGKDLTLRLIDDGDGKNGELKVGDRSWEIYNAGNTKVRVDYTVSKLCDPNDEACEVIYYKATITVIRNGIKETLKSIGYCGC